SRDLLALAEPPAGGRALDVGAGTGVTAAAASETMGPEALVVGVDPSIGMLRTGAGRRPGPRAAAQAIDLPFRDATFDLVTATFVLAHFTRYQTALFDMVRVLRPEGRLALSTWADGRDELTATWEELIETVVPREVLRSAVDRAAPWHDRFKHRAAIEEALLDAGLHHVRTEPAQYRFRYTIDEYLDGLSTFAAGRFVSEMLGRDGWGSFRERAKRVFAERFSDPLNDFRDVILAVASKP
ncbi:MAG: methyltransferase domain-containing protein, partial [Actinobacteria bacterium]|nr:methyltransferase domain-containing protein [Actinomycetota bacterium]